MIQRRHQLETFYRRLEAQEHLSCTEAMTIYDMLHKEAVSLGVIHSKNMLDGIEVNIKIASAVNKVAL